MMTGEPPDGSWPSAQTLGSCVPKTLRPQTTTPATLLSGVEGSPACWHKRSHPAPRTAHYCRRRACTRVRACASVCVCEGVGSEQPPFWGTSGIHLGPVPRVT